MVERFPSKMIHRESSRASVLNQLWEPRGEKKKHGKGVLCLDNAFALIEGHPQVPVYGGAMRDYLGR
jgi:hypothetical protein